MYRRLNFPPKLLLCLALLHYTAGAGSGHREHWPGPGHLWPCPTWCHITTWWGRGEGAGWCDCGKSPAMGWPAWHRVGSGRRGGTLKPWRGRREVGGGQRCTGHTNTFTRWSPAQRKQSWATLPTFTLPPQNCHFCKSLSGLKIIISLSCHQGILRKTSCGLSVDQVTV